MTTKQPETARSNDTGETRTAASVTCGTVRSSAWLGAVVLAAKTAIETSRRLEKARQLDVAWFVLRDLEAVKLAGLSDLAWSGCQQGNIQDGDLKYFIVELEAWLEAPSEKLSDRER